jgi:hypothetical protein
MNWRSEMNSCNRRPCRGSFLADAPIAIWLLLMLLFFPMIDLGTICLRATFLYFSVRNAVRSGSRAGSYQNPVNGPSAVQIVNNTVNTLVSGWNGLQVNSISTDIVITNLSTNVVTRQATKLSSPADDGNYTYQLEASVTGSVYPLVLFSSCFGSVPGLSAPMIMVMRDRQYFENPQVLNL